MASRLNATVVVLEVLSFLPLVVHIGLSHQGPATSRCSGFQTQGTQGGGTRSGEARGPECAGNSTPTLAGTEFPAGVGGTNADLGCGECTSGGGTVAAAATTTTRSGAQVSENVRDGVQGAARGYASRLGTWLDLRDQVPALSQHETQDLWRLQESLQFKEKHTLKVTFGDDCGDFFANCNSLEPRRRKPHAECLSVTRDRGRQKAQRRKRANGEFLARFEESLSW